jgi:outer membrane biosynthesis protein TonB
MQHPRTSRALAAVLTILLAAAFLPACGKKSVRSDNLDLAAATVPPTQTPNADLILAEFKDNPDVQVSAAQVPTLTPVPQDFAHVPDTVTMEPDTDMEEAKLKKKARPPKNVVVAEAPASEPSPTEVPVDTASSAAEPTPAPAAALKVDTSNVDPGTNGGTRISWLWWLLLILMAAVVGWYFWDKHQNEMSHGLSGSPLRPAPPLGGLSPVSGYYAKRKTHARARAASKKKR